MVYRVIAEVTMVVHFLFLGFVVLGGFVAWLWPRSIWLHLTCVLWGFSTVLFGVDCPLTHVEDWGRRNAGLAGLPRSGFIDHYIEGVIYPERYTTLLRILVVTAVLASWAGFYLRRRRHRATAH